MSDPFLLSFEAISNSLDIVDANTLRSIWQALGNYLERKYGVTHREVLEGIIVFDNHKSSLHLRSTLYGGFKEAWDFPIRNDKNGYNGQMAYAYENKCPLWIVSESRSNLKGAQDIVDLWSLTPNDTLPNYRNISETYSKTSIIIPLKGPDGFMRGVVNFKSKHFLPFSREIAANLMAISDRLGALIMLEKAQEPQSSNKKHALQLLNETARDTLRAQASPAVYLCYGDRCDKKVIAAIKQAIKSQKKDALEVLDWKRIHDGGSITSRMHSSFASCAFAVCYLTDIDQSGKKFDNPNVIFEAGCLQTLLLDKSSPLKDWILIRDKDYGEIPFDLRDIRAIMISGIEEELAHDLERRISIWQV